MTDRETFNSVGGFSEDFTIALNDVDYCFKVREAGKLVVYAANAELYHHESLSRGYDEHDEKKQLRFTTERALLNERWPSYCTIGDPYINRNIKAHNGYYQLY